MAYAIHGFPPVLCFHVDATFLESGKILKNVSVLLLCGRDLNVSDRDLDPDSDPGLGVLASSPD